MHQCPECGETLRDALVVCGHCGAHLPLQVIIVSEGSQGGGFAVVMEEREAGGKMHDAGHRKQEPAKKEEVNEL